MRHFIIFFTLVNEQSKGHGHMYWTDNKFPSCKQVIKYLYEHRDFDHVKENDYVITNILEVNKKDYDSWIS